ncbi:MAG: IS4 family transposase [Pirellulaceae bacterium]
MRSITEIVKCFKQDWTEELNPLKIEIACRDCGMSWISSMLNPVTTMQIFLLQILNGNTACTHLPHLAKIAFTAAGYCKARMRIKLEVFQLLLQRCVHSLHEQTLETGRWMGHRVFMVDGSSFSMSDTAELQIHFGQPGGQKPGCGFPVAHWLAMVHMGTGMITKMLASPLRTGDMTHVAKLHPELRKGDLLLADRAFCSFPHLCLLIERGVQAVLRIHHKINVDFTPYREHVIEGKGKSNKRKSLPRSRWLRGLGVNDQIVVWLKNPKSKPRWMSESQFESLRNEITVRELRYEVHQKGFRVKQITLVTTLLDDSVYSLPELAKLFRRRWEIETNFDHIKTTMKMDILKCQTVAGVLRELHVFALIYNLVRQVMIEAAKRQAVETNQISFIDALRWLKSADTEDSLRQLVVLPYRPDRFEPRVRKRRPKEYDLMTKTRSELKQLLAGQ